MIKENHKVERPFGIEFVEEIPEAELEKATGGAKVQTLALSISTHGPQDVTIYDEF